MLLPTANGISDVVSGVDDLGTETNELFCVGTISVRYSVEGAVHEKDEALTRDWNWSKDFNARSP